MRHNLEEIEQRKVIKYLDELKINQKLDVKFSAICHSTYTESIQAKTKNILDGLRRGLPDLFLIINKHPFFIEMKSSKGVLSDFQKRWINKINECEGIKAYVCYSFEDAKKVIDNYLQNFSLDE